MKTFVDDTSIVKKIWSTTDITLFIFAGASADFALNKQVDWLYFTGKLPDDPIGRLFSTVKYAQYIIFREEKEAIASIDKINSVHQHIEQARGYKITNDGYQDVLYMLIYYSMAAFELLERPLTGEEKDEIVQTFARIGHHMHIRDLPANYRDWKKVYDQQLTCNLIKSSFTEDLFRQYKKHLGSFRYFLLLDIQRMLVSSHVNKLLGLGRTRFVSLLHPIYKKIRKYSLHRQLIWMMVPRQFINHVKAMDKAH
ncbi:hypothetical protein A4D02_32770 [Niastella koreensis]|uniref:ER-bound oxygenase mpaB/mpaB'/Rubber oxygenase catalytic domain-containing protein n=2 Tax=Niastella koreensis TaxID=354356 RepID=G8T7G2_NIAKG|nr:oxygenase MpaB family protein [Niastella koreensis]AEW01198.1 hypothetical protein Niako_4958 [Niastella koreensis GR20-10]OQP45966.1 hypothetical protein A4D02_32770 [Niastella koreensis]